MHGQSVARDIIRAEGALSHGNPMLEYAAFVPQELFQPAVAISPDAATVAYSSNASGQFNLWLTPAEGGQARRLTEFTDRAVRQIAWAPDGQSLVFTADRNGDEDFQIYRILASGGDPEQLTNGGQHELLTSPFDATGRYLVYSANDRDEAVQDLIIRDMTTGNEHRRCIPEKGLAYHGVGISPDGRWLLASGYSSNIDWDCYLLDLTDPAGQPVRLTDGSAFYDPACWAPDSAGFYLRTTTWGQYVAAAYYSLNDKTLHPIPSPDWDVETIQAGGDTVLWAVNEDGRSTLYAHHAGTPLKLPELPAGVIVSIDLTGNATKAALQIDTATRPAEIAVLDLINPAFQRLTDTRPPALNVIETVEPSNVAVTARDGRTVHGLLYRPNNTHGDGPFPAVMWIHGGPEAQERPTYEMSGLYQYLLASGIAIYAPNAAGSTGYGTDFQTSLYRDWGGIDLADFEDAITHLRSLPWIDPQRLAVAGASYGGFAALSCLTRLPDLWAAGVSMCGPSNLITLAAACPPTWRAFVNKVLGDPQADADRLTERSPLTYINQLTAPLLVIQGAQDPRVPQNEADQVIDQLRTKGIEAQYNLYTDEGHGFTNRTNELNAFTNIATFLTNHLKPTDRDSTNSSRFGTS